MDCEGAYAHVTISPIIWAMKNGANSSACERDILFSFFFQYLFNYSLLLMFRVFISYMLQWQWSQLTWPKAVNLSKSFKTPFSFSTPFCEMSKKNKHFFNSIDRLIRPLFYETLTKYWSLLLSLVVHKSE